MYGALRDTYSASPLCPLMKRGEIPLIVFLYLIYLHSIWKCKTQKAKIIWEAAVLFSALFIVLYIFCFAEKCFNCEGRGHIRADCYSGPSERAKGAQRGKWRGRGGRRARGGGGGQQIRAIRVVIQSHCSFFRQAKNWEVANNSEKTKCFIIAFYIVKYRSMAGILHLCLTMVSLNWIKYSHEHLE